MEKGYYIMKMEINYMMVILSKINLKEKESIIMIKVTIMFMNLRNANLEEKVNYMTVILFTMNQKKII